MTLHNPFRGQYNGSLFEYQCLSTWSSYESIGVRLVSGNWPETQDLLEALITRFGHFSKDHLSYFKGPREIRGVSENEKIVKLYY